MIMAKKQKKNGKKKSKHSKGGSKGIFKSTPNHWTKARPGQAFVPTDYDGCL